MMCWKCERVFCWICAKVLPAGNPYSHFSNAKSPCYQQLFQGASLSSDKERVKGWLWAGVDPEDMGDPDWADVLEDADEAEDDDGLVVFLR